MGRGRAERLADNTFREPAQRQGVTIVSHEIYLSGPMSARPDANTTAFDHATNRLTELGYTVFSPASLPADDLPGIMRETLPAILGTTTAMVVLPGWETSTGSRLEVANAAAIGLPVREYDPTAGLGTVIYDANAGRDAVSQMLGGRNPIQELDLDEESPHEEAARIVLGPRGEFYDHPLDNFARTAHMWTGILYSKLRPDTTVSAEDVALCMESVKIAREAFRHKRDNIVDGHGYWMTLDMVRTERARRAAAQNAPHPS